MPPRKKKGTSAGRGGGGAKRPAGSGIEQYGQDEVDEFLKLDDDPMAAGEHDEDDLLEDEEDVFKLPEDEDEGDVRDEDADAEEKEKGGGDIAEAASGWRDFYGGDDAGDDSEAGSDEELLLAEARRLEQRRAQRLGAQASLLPAFVVPSDGSISESAAGLAGATAEATSNDGAARFDAAFAAEAEAAALPRDLSALPEAKRRSLMKREAPELAPLLEDFKAQIEELKALEPLVAPAYQGVSAPQLPASGAAYLDTKASLLMSNLANLSFYVLLRAEGQDVRNHPVAGQLVWLRALRERLGPLDKRLRLQLRKALRGARRAAVKVKQPPLDDAAPAVPQEAEIQGPQEGGRPPVRAPLSLREKVKRLRATQEAVGSGADASATGLRAARAPLGRGNEAVDALLRPVAAPRRGRPADAEDVDPTLGALAPTATLGELVTSAHQQQAARAKQVAGSGDKNVEARRRTPREKREQPIRESDDEGPEPEEGEELGPDVDDMVLDAQRKASEKRAARKAKEAERMAEKVASHWNPEGEAEGRRKTSKKILDNRGLTRVRKKSLRNPRVANRQKYEKTLKRRRGAVQDVREGAGDGTSYAGEATGVRTHVRKSHRLG